VRYKRDRQQIQSSLLTLNQTIGGLQTQEQINFPTIPLNTVADTGYCALEAQQPPLKNEFDALGHHRTLKVKRQYSIIFSLFGKKFGEKGRFRPAVRGAYTNPLHSDALLSACKRQSTSDHNCQRMKLTNDDKENIR